MFIKKFLKFKESLVIDFKDINMDINESLNIWIDSLLNSIKAEEIDMYDIFKINKDLNLDLEYLNNNNDFITSLSKSGLRKANTEITNNYETFIDINTPCRFMLIYDIKSSDLDNPYYILLQSYNNIQKKFEITKGYKINDDIKKFYDQLSSKIIEIIDGNDKFVYETSDRNNWKLVSLKETDIYKKNFTKDDLEKIIKERKVKVKII